MCWNSSLAKRRSKTRRKARGPNLFRGSQLPDEVISERSTYLVGGHRSGRVEPLADPVHRAHDRELDHLGIARPEQPVVHAFLDDVAHASVELVALRDD